LIFLKFFHPQAKGRKTYFIENSTLPAHESSRNFKLLEESNGNLWIAVARDHALIPPALDAHRHDL
jgi:hypothetical protein